MPDWLAGGVNTILEGLVLVVNSLVSIFPDSPFKSAIDSVTTGLGSTLLGYVNYFIPVSEMLSILSVWVAAIVFYYAISTILRWVRAIS